MEDGAGREGDGMERGGDGAVRNIGSMARCAGPLTATTPVQDGTLLTFKQTMEYTGFCRGEMAVSL